MPRSVFEANGLISFRVTELTEVRNPLGQFTSAQSKQRERNKEMATRIQQKAADLIEERIIWRAESTGALARNTLAPENAEIDTWRLGVGNPGFLDRSSSKYWRTVEQGSAGLWKHPFIGTHLFIRRGRGGGRLSAVTGFWTDVEEKSPILVRHEIQGQHVYNDASTDAALRDFGIRNVEQFVRDILT